MTKLFSIKKEYVDKIYNESKLVELRRQNVNLKKGEKCYIYTTAPEKKISGYFTVKNIIRTSIDELWFLTKDVCGVSKDVFFEYFKGCNFGTAIVFGKVRRLKDEITLEQIRIELRNFNPPQSYFKLDDFF